MLVREQEREQRGLMRRRKPKRGRLTDERDPCWLSWRRCPCDCTLADSHLIYSRERMTLLETILLPLDQRWILKCVLQIRGGVRQQIGPVGLKSKQHGREHRVGYAELAKQPAA